jgi:tetratricopeptide (TPR) repeat protein
VPPILPQTTPQLGKNGRRFLSTFGGLALSLAAVVLLGLGVSSPNAAGQEPKPATASAKEMFQAGKYAECVETAKTIVEADRYDEEARLILVAAELELGRYDDAKTDIEGAIDQLRASIRLKWLAARVLRYHSKEQAAAALKQLRELLEGAPYRYSGYEDQIVAARFLLSEGLDAKKALESILTPMKRRYPI